MAGKCKNRKVGLAARIAAAGLCVAAMPSAALGLGLIGSDSALIAFTPASADPELARLVAVRSGEGRLLRFTPAGVEGRSNRAVTVAVRVDPQAARAISVRAAIQAAKDQVAGEPAVGITATRYNLGIARGYQSFASKEVAAPVVARSLADAPIPDLASFRPATRPDEDGRFATRIALEEQAKAGAAPRTLDSRSDQRVDVGGSYRLTRNLDVTAGVRYSQERDRLAPLADPARQDSQAVYVGTQFRF